jgi:hypothetical protein
MCTCTTFFYIKLYLKNMIMGIVIDLHCTQVT